MLDRRSFLLNGTGFAAAMSLSSIVPQTLFAASDGFIELIAREGTAPLATSQADAKPTRIWGYNGGVPGPILRCKAGERIKVRLVNKLKQPTSIHWHGIRIQNDMDGVPGLTQEEVKPGESFDYNFEAPDAGTYWYHTHSRSWEQMARGLYGLLIVDESERLAFDQDIALAIDDWRLGPDGQIDEDSFGAMHDWGHEGRLGNWITTNGTSNLPIKLRSGQRVRLRLANTANARTLKINFDNHDMMLVALDGRPVPPEMIKEDGVILAPAQRADLSFVATGQPGSKYSIQETSYSRPFEFMHFVYEEGARQTKDGRTPLALTPTNIPKLDLANARRTNLLMTGGAMGMMNGAMHMGRMMSMRDLIENKKMWAFNGVAGDLAKPLVNATVGQTIVINMINDTGWPHAMHLHGHHFQVVERDGRPISSAPLRDTELMRPRERASIAFHADNPGKWLFHCHMLEHMAGGMATWINIENSV